MRRVVLISSLVLAAAACQVPPERTALRPLPEDAISLPYAELLTRARAQATNATVTVGGVGEDTIRNIENLTGGSGKETLTGGGGCKKFTGGRGKGHSERGRCVQSGGLSEK